MVYAESRIRPGKSDAKNSLGFWDTNGSSNHGKTRPDQGINEKKKRGTFDHRVKLRESENRDKYLDISKELKKKKQTMEHEGDGDTNCNLFSWYCH